MELAACAECNNGTRAADLVASFMARLGRSKGVDDWQITEAAHRKGKILQIAPGLLEELFRPEKAERIWSRGPTGLLRQSVKVSADGPLLNAYLTVFAAKMGVALYREHIGAALPLEGGVQTQWFLNAGLAQQTANAMLRILPSVATLTQSKFHATEQFAYKYNSDDRSIVAALISFHSNVHIFVIATSTPSRFQLPNNMPHSDFVRAGMLQARMPKHMPTF